MASAGLYHLRKSLDCGDEDNQKRMKTDITCLQWMGVAKAEPKKVTLSKEQLKRSIKCTEVQLEDLEVFAQYFDQATGSSISEIPVTSIWGMPMKLKKQYSYYEKEDYSNPKLTDTILVVGRVEDDKLEIYVYNEEGGVFYVHHDLKLSSFPLALEWIRGSTRDMSSGNTIAVGSMSSVIELWDLDLIDAKKPVFTLGQPQSKMKKDRKKKDRKKAKNGHTGAVLDLSWNRNNKLILASASADKTIAMWDLTNLQVAATLRYHTDKVQTIEWHPTEERTLVSGGFDKIVNLYDCRLIECCQSWNLNSKIERVLWNPSNTKTFLASTDDGFVYNLDVRFKKTVFSLKAHEKAVNGLTLSTEHKNCLTTMSADHFVKVWDITDNKPTLVASKDMKMNIINCLGSNPNVPSMLAMGGENDGVRLLDLSTVSEQFNLQNVSKSLMSLEIEEEGGGEGCYTQGKKTNKSYRKESKKKKKKKKRSENF